MRQVVEGDLPSVSPDVSITLASDDLQAIFQGTLTPMNAYLSGEKEQDKNEVYWSLII